MRRSVRLLVLAALAACTACGSGDPPRLAVGDLPAETHGAWTRAAFELRNEGGRTLTLDRVVPSCGCGAVSRLPVELVPKAAARLDVACIRTGVAGDDVRELALRTSDPRSPDTLLRVRLGRSVRALAPVYLGYVAVGETLVRDVVVPLLAGDVPTRSAGDVEVAAVPPSADGSRAVRVRFRPQRAGVVRTTIDLGPAGLLPITAIAWDRMMAFPAEVRTPRATGATGLPPLTLVAAGATPFAIARVEYPPGIDGEVRPVVPGRQYRLVLTVRGPAPSADAAIRVHGVGADDPVLVIPVVDASRAATDPPSA